MSKILTDQAFTNILGRIVPNLFDLQVLVREDILRLWKVDHFQTENPPVLQPGLGIWSYKGHVGALFLPHLPQALRAKIIEFLCEDHMYWQSSDYFKRMLGATRPSTYRVTYTFNYKTTDVDICFPALAAEIKNIRGEHLYENVREPYGEFTVVQRGAYILARSPCYGRAFGQILNHHFAGEAIDDSLWEVVNEKPDGDVRFLPYACTHAFNCHSLSLTEATKNALKNLGVQGEEIKFYIKYVQKPPLMWQYYRDLLEDDGVPCDVLNRIPDKMQNMLCNLGRKVQIGWSEYRQKYHITGPCGFTLDLDLKTMRDGEPPAKRQRTGLVQAEQNVLREMAPGYFAVHSVNSLMATRQGPKYLTQKGTFVDANGWVFGPDVRVWTGRVFFSRTWQYEIVANNTLGYMAGFFLARYKKLDLVRFTWEGDEGSKKASTKGESAPQANILGSKYWTPSRISNRGPKKKPATLRKDD